MNTLIIEDEPVNARRLQKLTGEADPDIRVLDILDSVESAVEWLQNHEEPDLIFMDIQLADGLSFEIFEKVKVSSPVIFTTAFDQFAIQAFKNNGVDYLLKPVNLPELAAALTKVKRYTAKATVIQPDLSSLLRLLSAPSKEMPKRIIVKYGQNIKAIDFTDIAAFFSEGKSVSLLTMKNEHYPVDETLEKLEKTLDNTLFFRVNRSTILNFNAIDCMTVYSKSRVKIGLKLPLKLEVIASTERSGDFKNWLAGKRE